MVCRLADSKIQQPASTISLQVFYEGNVQGVGFRWSVRHAAKGFDVTGWVRNLPDGRVELNLTGEEEEVRAFLDRIVRGELHSLIHKQTEKKLDKPVSARGFEIRHD
ncbi:MAG: acylphosphatase [Verrucomicrobia bacterium]|nr:MAG: acylphosphatase [Verrucomicrobiota bacterium]